MLRPPDRLYQTPRESGVDVMHEILKKVWEEEQMPKEWEKREIVPIYKQKRDPLECKKFRGIKLLEDV